MSELEDKAEKATKAAKSTATDVRELFAQAAKETAELRQRCDAIEAGIMELQAQIAIFKASLPPTRLTSSEVRDLIAANPYCTFRILEPVKLSGMMYHKGHVFRADTMRDVPAMVQSAGLQLAVVEE